MDVVIFNDIYSMMLDNKRRKLFKWHAKNFQRTALEKSQFESVDILNSVFADGSVNDIKLMCSMSDRDVLRKYREYCCDDINSMRLCYSDYRRECEEIRKAQNKMNLFLETRCPLSKKC